MPSTDRNGLAISVRVVPGQADSCSGPGGSPLTWALSPSHPPTRASPATVSGISRARMTKNCRTSL